jgi:hypothetical protein
VIWFEALVSGLALAFGIWQLFDLRRERKRDAAKRAASKEQSSTASRHPER